MINISQDFAPPFKLVIPYFIIGVIFYLLSSIYLFTLDLNTISTNHLELIAFVHIFLLGFVMMIIFGAMAQLIPVTLEVGHFSVEFYYLIYPLLLIGTILMFFGFTYSLSILPYAGLIVFLSMTIFLVEAILTIKKVENFTNVIKMIIVSKFFLFIGIIFGLLMTFSYTGQIAIDISAFSKIHVFSIIFGYVMITIMALSIILLPMFGLSHNFSQKPLNNAVILMFVSITLIIISSLVGLNIVSKVAYILVGLSISMYIYQIVLIYKARARKAIDIYYKSLFLAFFCLVLALLFALSFILFNKEVLLFASFWLLISGFFAYLIIAHLYKIVPFLVWFDKFSPLVGKQKVPLLTDMVNDKSANFQFNFAVVALILSTFAILIKSNSLFHISLSFLCISALFLVINIINIIRYE